MTIFRMNVFVDSDGAIAITSRYYTGVAASKRCHYDARKFSKESGHNVSVYRVPLENDSRLTEFYYFGLSICGCEFRGEKIEDCTPAS